MTKDYSFRLSTGQRGEMIGCGFLVAQGFRILDKNYRCKIGEIDVVAEKNGKICFIEIKTRTSARYGEPQDSVTEIKQRKLVQLARWYLKDRRLENRAALFHVLAVTLEGSKEPRVRIIENAFSA